MDRTIPIPLEVSRQISELATRRAREGLVRRGWSPRSQAALVPAPREGAVGIRSTVKYLIYQNRGFGPFLMTALEGKVVPIRGQFFTVKNVGMPGWGYQDRKYEKYKGPIWRQQRWRHPGIRPEKFMENAISQAILESRPRLRSMTIQALLGTTGPSIGGPKHALSSSPDDYVGRHRAPEPPSVGYIGKHRRP